MVKETLLQVVSVIRQFIGQTFHNKNENLPFYVTILVAAIVFIVGLNGFVEMTDELAENELEQFDKVVTQYVISFRSDALTRYFTFVTDLGDRWAYVVFTVLLAAYFFVRYKSWKFVLQMTIVLLLATLSNMVLKKVINRSRPVLEHLVSVNTLSYPSGHSMSAMAFYGFLIFLCIRYRMSTALKYTLVVILSVLIVSIGLSRIYLGVHYPSDVAAGFIGGLIWVAFCAVIFSIIDLLRRRNKDEGEQNTPQEAVR